MRILWRLLGYVRPYMSRLIAASVMLAIAGALMAAVVSALKPLVNDVLAPSITGAGGAAATGGASGSAVLEWVRGLIPVGQVADWAREHAFVEIPLLMVGVFFVRAVFLYFGQYLTMKCGASMIRDLRLDLYEGVAYQSLDFFQAHPTGVVLSRILNDVAWLQRVATVTLADLVRVGVMVPFLLATALLHEWRMTMLSIVGLPLLAYPMIRLGKRLRRASTASQENMADVAHKLTEAIAGVRVVQGFGMEQYELERVGGSINRLLRAELKAGRATALGPSLMELFGAAVGCSMFMVAGLRIANNQLDAGDFTVVLGCLGLLFMSIRRLNRLYSDSQRAVAAAERVFGMLDHERRIADRPDARPLDGFEREIAFDGVRFSYGDDDVLAGIDLTIAKGEVVALVGPSGAGKSTLANLLPRFYDPTVGAIRVDGQDIRDATLVSLREQIGLVTQETILFDDTVRNNIAYGHAELPLERVVEVAKAAQVDGFVGGLPEGYDTMLGERGTRLSMGQRQRVTIARALLKNPPILILDEATSALDAESESLVQQALEVLMRGRTSIVIAHRLSTVRRADRIVVLDAGRIVEIGSHDELLAKGGAYARFYELQFRESA